MTKTSKTQRALALVAQGMPALEAARKIGIQPNGLYVAIKRERERAAGVCPTCGQPLPESNHKKY